MSEFSITCVCANPAIDATLRVRSLVPGGTNRVLSESREAAGKGVNVALIASGLTVSGLTASVRLIGIFGADSLSEFGRACEDARVTFDPVTIPGATRVNTKIFDESRGVTTELNASGASVPTDAVRELLERAAGSARDSEWLVLTGSLPPGCPSDFYARVIRAAREIDPNVKIALDASGEALRAAIPETPDFMKPNLAELSELVGRELHGAEEAIEAAKTFASRGAAVLVSLGSDGSALVTRDSVLRSHPSRGAMRSTVGAGDSMVAAFVAAKCRGESDEDAFRAACSAAAKRVGAE